MTSEKPRFPKPAEARRKAISVAPAELLTAEPLSPDSGLPLLVRPAVPGVSLRAVVAQRRAQIAERLAAHGALLFRDFDIGTVEEFERLIVAAAGGVLEYADQTSPRHKVSGNVYTSTDYPADQPILLHNENSYAHSWPMKLFFFCVTPAARGGETPIADTRLVLARIDPRIRERFEEKGWMLVRNFGRGLGLSWETVFQTADRAEVDAYCRAAGIETEWQEGGRLRTRQVRRAVVSHPRTGERVWFNHAAFFHVSALAAGLREGLLAGLGEDELPYNTYYGDGSPIEESVAEALREAYRQSEVAFEWRAGDVLLLDNMLAAHGRRPFEGPRRVVVGMAEPVSVDDV